MSDVATVDMRHDGPRPTRDDRPAPAPLRVLRAVVDAGHPVATADLAATLGGHPNGIRLHLDRLEEQGFVTRSTRAAEGRGRPALLYTPTVWGRQVAGEDDTRIDIALIEAIADHLGDDPDPSEAAMALGRRWGERLGAHDTVGLLARQGFTPQPSPEGTRLLTCPVIQAARRRPALVCAIHQGMLDAVSPRPLRLVPFWSSDACLVADAPGGRRVEGSGPAA